VKDELKSARQKSGGVAELTLWQCKAETFAMHSREYGAYLEASMEGYS
jgi:hypothetical protein